MTEKDIERIIQEVLKCLREEDTSCDSGKKALLVYTGAAIGFDETLSCLRELLEAGYSFDVYFSKGAQAALDAEAVKRGVLPGRFIEDGDGSSPEAVGKEYDLIIVPTLTVNTAAKLCSCMMDTPVTRLIFNAMMLGKTMVLVTDGCCPDHERRKELGYFMPEGIKKQLRNHLERLKEYGAKLTSAANLAKAVKKLEAPRERASESGGCAKAGYPAKRVVIGRKQVDDCPEGGTLVVPANAVITALACDIALERNITMVKEREGTPCI